MTYGQSSPPVGRCAHIAPPSGDEGACHGGSGSQCFSLLGADLRRRRGRGRPGKGSAAHGGTPARSARSDRLRARLEQRPFRRDPALQPVLRARPGPRAARASGVRRRGVALDAVLGRADPRLSPVGGRRHARRRARRRPRRARQGHPARAAGGVPGPGDGGRADRAPAGPTAGPGCLVGGVRASRTATRGGAAAGTAGRLRRGHARGGSAAGRPRDALRGHRHGLRRVRRCAGRNDGSRRGLRAAAALGRGTRTTASGHVLRHEAARRHGG